MSAEAIRDAELGLLAAAVKAHPILAPHADQHLEVGELVEAIQRYVGATALHRIGTTRNLSKAARRGKPSSDGRPAPLFHE